ncbi:short-chain dehydrogenase/reductase family protein [Penicillium lagena]|uniref:short-chain dehydrogenase/reductase family protein n=1 Tax=Penicillium lagena TaxID=94218 RepID=UPI00253F6AE5|nr:short-chain dehydrogenase/reductase family protein [Penicillium lagena]KAJ5605718.1 short-chain dehydrogenase/reductase family protein [Penicillium lagena]
MPVLQPKVTPLPPGIDLSGKTAVITGASAGLGLETARQLLALKCSTVILAVRNISKGGTCKESLQRDPEIKKINPNATIKVLKLDVDRYDSVQDFTKVLQQGVPVVNILILNAGISNITFSRSPNGHENHLQINYLSNVILLAELLPYLEASAEIAGFPTRITWVGSRMHDTMNSFTKKAPIKRSESVLERMDSKEAHLPYNRYGDSKLLCAMFMYTLAPRLDTNKVIINMICPGMIDTGLTDSLPVYLRLPVNVLKALRARPLQVGGWLIVNAAVVAGPESHGRHLGDKDILNVSEYIRSPAGQEVQRKLWVETMEEMQKLTSLPVQFVVEK